MFNCAVVLLHAGDALTETVSEIVTATKGCHLRITDCPESAHSLLRQGGVGLFVYSLADVSREPDVAAFLDRVREAGSRVPVLVLSDAEEPELGLRLLRRGAVDCLTSPLNVARLAFLVDFLTLRARFHPEDAAGKFPCVCQEPGNWVADFLFATPAMQQLLGLIRSVARLDTTLLITGETGTGKSHLARVVHELSPRRDRPFAVVHCGALSSTLIRSELFGHVRGAFTGADDDRTGRFADAQDGTILVDEIDCLPLDVQANLLRAVEDRVFEPVGSVRSQPLRARLVVTSNQRLEDEVAAGRFRADLYHRLNVVNLALPPLRETPSHIRCLAEKFLAHYCRCAERPLLGLSKQTLWAMEHYRWPGNVRELRNLAERSAAICPGPIVDLADLPDCFQESDSTSAPSCPQPILPRSGRLTSARQDFEFSVFREALARHNNNRTEAAKELGISRVTLYRKLQRYGLS